MSFQGMALAWTIVAVTVAFTAPLAAALHTSSVSSSSSSSLHHGIPTDVLNGFCARRSPPVVTRPAAASTAWDMRLSLYDPAELVDGGPTSMTLQSVSPVAAQALGVQPHHHTTAFPLRNIMQPARGNVLLAVESLGTEGIEALHLAHLADPSLHHVTLVDEAYPHSTISAAATLATATLPKEHCIVAPEWPASPTTAKAYTAPSTGARTTSLADAVSQTFGGKAITLSLSGDPQHAAAHCVSDAAAFRATKAHTARSDFCAAFDARSHAFQPLERATAISTVLVDGDAGNAADAQVEAALSMTAQELLDRLHDEHDSFLVALVDATASATTHRSGTNFRVTVHHDTVAHTPTSFTYDLATPTHLTLFLEMQYLWSLPVRLKTVFTAKQQGPAYVALTVSSLTALVEQYGHQSDEYVAAAHVLDAALPALLHRWISLTDVGATPPRALGQLVLLGSHESSREVLDRRAVLAQASSVLPEQDAGRFFPSFAVPLQATREVVRVCEELMVRLLPLDFETFCPAYEGLMGTLQGDALVELTDMSHLLGNATAPTEDEVALYQIALWTSVLLGLAVIVAVYATVFMENYRDPLLYSVTPDWDDRKRR